MSALQDQFVCMLMHKFQIKQDEKNLVALSLFSGFLLGCILTYLSAVPMAIFLANYNAKYLPMIYFAHAVGSTIFGFIYTRAQNYLTFEKLLFSLIVIMTSITVLLWAGLFIVKKEVSVLLIIWTFVAYDLYIYALWTAFNRVYTLQQGKRIYGISGACQGFGGALAGFTLPLLLLFIDIDHVILFIALLTILFGILLLKILQFKQFNHSKDEETDEGIEQHHPTPSKEISPAKNYVVMILLLNALTISILYIIDLMFNTEAQRHFQDEKALAGFISIIYAIIDISAMVISGVFYHRILKKFGVIFSLTTVPLFTGIVAVAVLAVYLSSGFSYAVFWLTTCMFLMGFGSQLSIMSMSKLLILQPLSVHQRTIVQSTNEVLVSPISTLCISVVMLAISYTLGVHVPLFTSILILICTTVITIIYFGIGPGYIQSLKTAMTSQLTVNNTQDVLIENNKALFDSYLTSPYPEEVIDALNRLDKINKYQLEYTSQTIVSLVNDAVIEAVIVKVLALPPNELEHKKILSQRAALMSYCHVAHKLENNYLQALSHIIDSDLAVVDTLHDDVLSIPIREETQFFRETLHQRIKILLGEIFLIVDMLDENSSIKKLLPVLEAGDRVKVEYALELIYYSLPKAHKEKVIPALNKIYLSKQDDADEIDLERFSKVLKKYLRCQDMQSLTLLSCIASIYSITKLSLKDLYPDVNALQNSSFTFIGEVVEWSIKNRD